MNIIAAPVGYFALSYCAGEFEGDDIELVKTAILGWCIDQSDPSCVWPTSILLDPYASDAATLRPDGAVEGLDGDFLSATAWLEQKRKDLATARARKATGPAGDTK